MQYCNALFLKVTFLNIEHKQFHSKPFSQKKQKTYKNIHFVDNIQSSRSLQNNS